MMTAGPHREQSKSVTDLVMPPSVYITYTLVLGDAFTDMTAAAPISIAMETREHVTTKP